MTQVQGRGLQTVPASWPLFAGPSVMMDIQGVGEVDTWPGDSQGGGQGCWGQDT